MQTFFTVNFTVRHEDAEYDSGFTVGFLFVSSEKSIYIALGSAQRGGFSRIAYKAGYDVTI